MIPFWQIRNQYNVNKERQNKSKCLHLHKHMQSRAGLKHGSFVQKWTVCSLFHWASITKPERRRRETSPLRRRTKAALLFALFQHEHHSSKRRLCQVRFLLCFCTNLLYVQQQEAEESRWIIQAMSSEHLCRFCHLKKQEDNEPDGSFICDEETINVTRTDSKFIWTKAGTSSTRHTLYSHVFFILFSATLHQRLQESTGALWIPAGTVAAVDYSPLIHLASGSWALNSALNRSSTASLVSLPAWVSTAKKQAFFF